jgi:hypothetical protein
MRYSLKALYFCLNGARLPPTVDSYHRNHEHIFGDGTFGTGRCDELQSNVGGVVASLLHGLHACVRDRSPSHETLTSNRSGD